MSLFKKLAPLSETAACTAADALHEGRTVELLVDPKEVYVLVRATPNRAHEFDYTCARKVGGTFETQPLSRQQAKNLSRWFKPVIAEIVTQWKARHPVALSVDLREERRLVGSTDLPATAQSLATLDFETGTALTATSISRVKP